MSMRPVFRVASAGLDPRDVRLIEIVFQHSQYNCYDFGLVDGRDSERIDILIANPNDEDGRQALTSAASLPRPIPGVSAVRHGTQATAPYSITLDRLTLQLLPTLNRVVEAERLLEAGASTLGSPCARDAPSGSLVAAPGGRQVRLSAHALIPVLGDSHGDGVGMLSQQTLAGPQRQRLQVLVADPSSAAQQQLTRALHQIGLEAHCVDSAAAAMQYLSVRHVDLVITESGLADSDGFELIRRMRAVLSCRYTPVLLLRSRLQFFDALRARLAGDVSVLTKPLTRLELDSVVRRILRSSVILDDLDELLSPA